MMRKTASLICAIVAGYVTSAVVSCISNDGPSPAPSDPEPASIALTNAVHAVELWLENPVEATGSRVSIELRRALSSATNAGVPLTQQVRGYSLGKGIPELVTQVRQRQMLFVSEREFLKASQIALTSPPESLQSGGSLFGDAIGLLEGYVRTPGVAHKETARRLLSELKLATAKDAACQFLLSLNDAEFNRIPTGNIPEDVRLTNPPLQEVRRVTLRRFWSSAKETRDVRKSVDRLRNYKTRRREDLARWEARREEQRRAEDAREARRRDEEKRDPPEANVYKLNLYPESYAGRHLKLTRVLTDGNVSRLEQQPVVLVPIFYVTKDGAIRPLKVPMFLTPPTAIRWAEHFSDPRVYYWVTIYFEMNLKGSFARINRAEEKPEDVRRRFSKK